MDIQNTYNPAAFFEEIQNITNEIEGIFKDYNFHIEKKDLLQFVSSTMLYEVQTQLTIERIVNDIELYRFLNDNESELELHSPTHKGCYKLDIFQIRDFKSKILNKINTNISSLIKKSNNQAFQFESIKLSIDQWYEILTKHNFIIKQKNNKELVTIRNIYKFATTKGLIVEKINQKGTNALTNKDLSFIYDIIFFIKNKKRDTISNTKEKSDYIRYRQKKSGKKKWEIMFG